MIPKGTKIIKATRDDRELLQNLIYLGIPPINGQPTNYDGVVVLKPWGYEFQVFNSKSCCVWLACLFPGQAVSLHCHRRKQALFVPLSDGVMIRTLKSFDMLTESIGVDVGVFHSQENNGDKEAFFLEYEWPSEKTDLVRAKDRYGREDKGYEGISSMITFEEAIDRLKSPALSMFMGEVA